MGGTIRGRFASERENSGRVPSEQIPVLESELG
jgi:hypothetical protein